MPFLVYFTTMAASLSCWWYDYWWLISSNGFARRLSSPNTGVKPVLEGTEKTTKNLSRDSRWPGRNSNWSPPEYTEKQVCPNRGPSGCITWSAATFVNFTVKQFRRLGITPTEVFNNGCGPLSEKAGYLWCTTLPAIPASLV
jgi:hypothetical protein